MTAGELLDFNRCVQITCFAIECGWQMLAQISRECGPVEFFTCTDWGGVE